MDLGDVREKFEAACFPLVQLILIGSYLECFYFATVNQHSRPQKLRIQCSPVWLGADFEQGSLVLRHVHSFDCTAWGFSRVRGHSLVVHGSKIICYLLSAAICTLPKSCYSSSTGEEPNMHKQPIPQKDFSKDSRGSVRIGCEREAEPPNCEGWQALTLLQNKPG